ncbi:hypothetical protein ZWY2020_057994 [Hordeum vulgare]|nr:hypothetical protein ZWY2020_057994 [Hordeum vulgare]
MRPGQGEEDWLGQPRRCTGKPPKEEGYHAKGSGSSSAFRGRNKDKPNGNKKEKAMVKRMPDAISLRDQIGDVVKMKETMLDKHWDAKISMAKKKRSTKRINGKRGEKNRKDERTTQADLFRMMNPEGVNAMSREFWEMKRMEIMLQRKMELQNLMTGGGVGFGEGFSFGNGGGFLDTGGGSGFGMGGGVVESSALVVVVATLSLVV